MTFSIVILAAGKGTRMQSSTPKVLQKIAGRPLLKHIVKSAWQLNPQEICLVYSTHKELLKKSLAESPNLIWVEQTEQLGTGHAMLVALPHLKAVDQILVWYADVPLIRPETIKAFFHSTPRNGLGLLTYEHPHPKGFGRILRDEAKQVTGIIEEKDASDAQKEITEICTGFFIFPGQHLSNWLNQLKSNNEQGEFYLTDIVAKALLNKVAVSSYTTNNGWEVQGVNTLGQLIQLERDYQVVQAENYIAAGVHIVDPNRFDLRGSLTAGKNVLIDHSVTLEGEVILEDGVQIGPNVYIKNCHVASKAIVKAFSHLEGAWIGPNVSVGPFARLRPETKLHENSRVGSFVELKKAEIGIGSKINHLSYVGDASIGQNVNVGAGVITCNYDGKQKHRTEIADCAFIGANVALIAPIKVGYGAIVGAGTTLVKDAPAHKISLNQLNQIDKDLKK